MVSLLPKILSVFPRWFRRQFQYILSLQLLSRKSRFWCFARSLARDSPHLFTTTSLIKTLLHPEFGTRLRSLRPLFQNWFSLPLFPQTERRCHFRFRVLANRFASIFLLPLSGDSFGPLSLSPGHKVQTSVGFHSDLDLLLRPWGIDLYYYSSF